MLLLQIVRRLSGLNSSFANRTITVGNNEKVDSLEILSDPKLSYQEVFFKLQKQALNSMLLYVKTENNVNQLHLKDHLHKFCSNFDNIAYLDAVKWQPNFFLVEFSSNKGMQSLISTSKEGTLFLRIAELSPDGIYLPCISSSKSWYSTSKSNVDMSEKIRNASNVSEQINLYYYAKRANSDHVRQNIFLALLFQDFFNWHMKANITAVPFGSSYSVFSSPTGDVDISLVHLSDGRNQASTVINSLKELPAKAAKSYKMMQRSGANALFAEASKHIEKYLPFVTNVSTHDAMFPLIKLHFSPFQANVDISFNNKSSIQSTWAVNVYTRSDKRIAPFLFLLRQWAKQAGLAKHGGLHYDGLTPYMIDCFALFYLMRCKPSVILPIKELFSFKPSKNDIIISGFRTKFKQNCLSVKGSNTKSLEDLLIGFFQYYCDFDFYCYGINLATGDIAPKSLPTLMIHTSFGSFNVGKNCSIRNLNIFQKKIRELLTKLEHNKRNWGILSFIDVEKDAQ